MGLRQIKRERGSIDLITRASDYAPRDAVVDASGRFTYRDLLDASARAASDLLHDNRDLREARVAFLIPPGFHYVATQWGIWRAGGVAVPLALAHPEAELAYVMDDARPMVIVAHPDLEDRVRGLATERGLRFVRTTELLSTHTAALPDIDQTRRAMMLYTSGTTGKPKGVVTTHANIRAQVVSLVEAWEWTREDRVLLVLPLHHVHGIVNVVTCALWSGACCDILPRFDATETWTYLIERPLTLFMAVPTIYRRLIMAWEQATPADRAAMSEACTKLRLMISGSAALPVDVLEQWKELSGHVLLERYGMTEIGMGLSNPVHGDRVPGSVGGPLPGVDVRLVDEEKRDVPAGMPGEILIRGPNVFGEYWGKPADTASAFHDGWFITGDIAVLENGRYRIMGRRSVDIIKTGGYKVSALEIEEVLRTHPAIRECAVVGVPDEDWGERVCVAVELAKGADLELSDLQAWAGERLAAYKVPKAIQTVTTLPRNPMGKVTKPDVVKLFE